MAGKFLRGALVEFKPAFVLPLPNVIVFQYNPETMTHTWTPPAGAGPAAAGPGSAGADPLAVQGVPGEQFSFTLAMDAGEMIADGSPVATVLAATTGVYSRLAALELLLYPVPAGGTDLLASVSASVSVGSGGVSLSAGAKAGGKKATVPKSQAPMVLFVWGPGRILPVRLMNLTITEKLYDAFLNPTHAEAQITLKVLTSEELKFAKGLVGDVATAAYKYSQALREVLAVANLASAAESIIGMLPL